MSATYLLPTETRGTGLLTFVRSIVTKTQAYLEVFSRFKTQETAQAVERILLSQKDLSSFERAQLGM